VFYVNPDANASYTLYAKTEDGCVAAMADAAAVTVNPVPTGLSLTASPAVICIGGSVTLTASATGAASYSLDGSAWQTSTEFIESPAASLYTLHAITAEDCTAPTPYTVGMSFHPPFSTGTITTASATATAGVNAPAVTISNMIAATGHNIAYQWRRSGTSNATLSGANETYNLGNDIANHLNAGGTFYFNRYVRDDVCGNTEWVASAGTFTLYLEPNPVPVTLCTQCCWSGSAWTNCYVTSNSYPFDDAVTNTRVLWHNGGYNVYYRSPENGRLNTINIPSLPGHAVQICKDLGEGWYLPAYEELINMSDFTKGSYLAPANGRDGAGILVDDTYSIWSSTQHYNNGGRLTSNADSNMYYVVVIPAVSSKSWGYASMQTGELHVHCAWMP
jgi:hypothetical protein